MLVVVYGLPGTGKTTVAKALGKELRAIVLSTDEIRARVYTELGYTRRAKRRVYEAMFSMAEDQLKKNKPVILDATFFKKKLRERALALAEKMQERIYFLECLCDEEVVKERIEQRFKAKKDYSEANVRVYYIIKAEFQPWKRKRFVLDTTLEWRSSLGETVNKIRINESLKEVIEPLMRNPEFFDVPPTKKVRLKQTHISFVLLTGRQAYKIKKPVRYSFVDYSSLEKRKAFCQKEVELNRRLCPELYLGVVPITKSQSVLAVGGKGEVIEFAVKMKEFSQKNLLSSLLEKNQVKKELVERIAFRLAEFHRQAKTVPENFGSTAIVKENFEHFIETRPIIEEFLGQGRKVDLIEERFYSFMKKNKRLFEKRVKEKRIRECHGDVRARNIIVLRNKPCIFDCIEFNEKIKNCDTAAEIAFLAMDLDFYGKKEFSQAFVKAYLEKSQDKELIKLLDFYKCYRASVGALVEAFKLADESIPKKEKNVAKKHCLKYVKLALSYAKKLK